MEKDEERNGIVHSWLYSRLGKPSGHGRTEEKPESGEYTHNKIKTILPRENVT